MDDKRIGAAPDYTNAALTMLGINLMWIMFVVWMLWGLVPTLMLAFAVNHWVEHVAARRGVTPLFGHLRFGLISNRDPQA